MVRKRIRKPTRSELEILQVLWDNGPSTVRFVNDRLQEVRPTGYTTTLKLMQLMNDKGLLERDTSQRSHTYTALVMEDETKRELVSNFLDSAFGGSPMKLVMQVLGDHKVSREELDQIRDYVEEIEKEQQ